ncbi:MAG: Integrase [Rhizobium sp.]|nr:Integrase [Rhizobium sp.]
MARNKLSEAKIKALVQPGIHGDGDGLWLRVQKSGSRNWIFIYRRGDKRHEIGLGGHGSGTAPVSVAVARQKADAIRLQLARGEDPRAAKTVRPKTFHDCAVALIDAKRADWTGEHTAREWELHLLDYAKALHDKPVADILIGDVKEAILSIWKEKPSTGRRLLDRIKAAIDYGIAHQWRTAGNPAIWSGLLDKVMPKPARQKNHHAALGYKDCPTLFTALAQAETSASRAVELLALTATRSAETREAVWSEFDLDSALWTIPAVRMKAERDHEIPLSTKAR